MVRLWLLLLVTWGLASGAFADAESMVDPCNAAARQGKYTWVDKTHLQISQLLCWPSRWVDHFFHDHTGYRWQEAGTTVRLTQTATWRDDHQSSTPFDIHARAELPGLEKRFKLFFVNDEDVLEAEHKKTSSQSGETDNQTKGFRAALRLALRKSRHYGLDFDVGLRSGLHAYSQIRYQWHKPVSMRGRLAFEQTFYYLDPEGGATNSLLEYAYDVSSKGTIRLSSNALYSEENHEEGKGWVISQNVAYYYRIDDQSAIKFRLGTYGYTEPGWAIQKYYFSTLYRRNFFRSWLFYEIEPFWEWPKDQGFGTVTGLSLRLEVILGFADD